MLTITPEMMGAFLESSSSASLNCSNVMVQQDFPLREESAQGLGQGHSPP